MDTNANRIMRTQFVRQQSAVHVRFTRVAQRTPPDDFSTVGTVTITQNDRPI